MTLPGGFLDFGKTVTRPSLDPETKARRDALNEVIRSPEFSQAEPDEQLRIVRAAASQLSADFANAGPLSQQKAATQLIGALQPSRLERAASYIPVVGRTLSAAQSRVGTPGLVRASLTPQALESPFARAGVTLLSEAGLFAGAVYLGGLAGERIASGLGAVTPGVLRGAAGEAVSGTVAPGLLGRLVPQLGATATRSAQLRFGSRLLAEAELFSIGDAALRGELTGQGDFNAFETLVADPAVFALFGLGLLGAGKAVERFGQRNVGLAAEIAQRDPGLAEQILGPSRKLAAQMATKLGVSQEEAAKVVFDAARGEVTESAASAFRNVLAHDPVLLDSPVALRILKQIHPGAREVQRAYGEGALQATLMNKATGETRPISVRRPGDLVDLVSKGEERVVELSGKKEIVDRLAERLSPLQPRSRLLEPEIVPMEAAAARPQEPPQTLSKLEAGAVAKGFLEGSPTKPTPFGVTSGERIQPSPHAQDARGVVGFGPLGPHIATPGVDRVIRAPWLEGIKSSRIRTVPPDLPLAEPQVLSRGGKAFATALTDQGVVTLRGLDGRTIGQMTPGRFREAIERDAFDLRSPMTALPDAKLGDIARRSIATRRSDDALEALLEIQRRTGALGKPVPRGPEQGGFLDALPADFGRRPSGKGTPASGPIKLMGDALGLRVLEEPDGLISIAVRPGITTVLGRAEAEGFLTDMLGSATRKASVIADVERQVARGFLDPPPAAIEAGPFSAWLPVQDALDDVRRTDLGRRWFGGRAFFSIRQIAQANASVARLGDDGVRLASMADEVQELQKRFFGSATEIAQQAVKGLDAEAGVTIGRILEGKPLARLPEPREAAAAARFKDIYDDTFRVAEQVIGPVGPGSTLKPREALYMNHITDWEAVFSDPALLDKHLRGRMKQFERETSRPMSRDEAIAEVIRERSGRRVDGRPLSAFLEHERLGGDLYEPNAVLAMEAYLWDTSWRLAEARVFGRNWEKTTPLIESLKARYLEDSRVGDWLDRWTRMHQGRGFEAVRQGGDLLDTIMRVNRGRLLMSGIPNLTDNVMSALATSEKSFVQGFFRGSTEQGRLDARLVGSTVHTLARELDAMGFQRMIGGEVIRKATTPLGRAATTLRDAWEQVSTATLRLTEDFSVRPVAVASGRAYFLDAIARLRLNPQDAGARRALIRFRFDPEKTMATLARNPALEERMALVVGQEVSSRMIGEVGPGRMPMFFSESPWGRFLLQFQPFIINRTKAMLDVTAGAIRRGDTRQLLRSLAYMAGPMPAAGLFYLHVRSLYTPGADLKTQLLRDLNEDDGKAKQVIAMVLAGNLAFGSLGKVGDLSRGLIDGRRFTMLAMVTPVGAGAFVDAAETAHNLAKWAGSTREAEAAEARARTIRSASRFTGGGAGLVRQALGAETKP